MDSCLPSSPAARDVAEKTKSYRATHNSFLLHGVAVASSKSRKPSASASKLSGRLHPSTSKILASSHIEKKADVEPPIMLQGLPSPKSGDKVTAGHESLRKGIAVVRDAASKNEKDVLADEESQDEKTRVHFEGLQEVEVVAEDEVVNIEKAVAKDGALGEKMAVFIDEPLRTTGIQNDASPLKDIADKVNDASPLKDISDKKSIEGHDCIEYKDALVVKEEKEGEGAETSVTDNNKKNPVAMDTQEGGFFLNQKEKEAVTVIMDTEGIGRGNALKVFFKAPAQQGLSSPVADTKTIVYSEQNRKSDQTVPGLLKQMEGELEVKQSGCELIFTEHLTSEQERFLFTKGEPIFKESIQSSEGLPAVEGSTLKKFKEQDASSFSQSETAGVTASTPSSAVLDMACNSISSTPSSEDRGFIEAAMFALAKDVVSNCPTLENVHCISGRATLSCPWKLSRRKFFIPSLVVPALLCLFCFALALTWDKTDYLHPT